MSTRTPRIVCIIALATSLVFGGAPRASAQDSASTGRLLTDFVRPLAVDGFDDSAGVLVAADLSLRADLDSRVVELTNSSAAEADFLITTMVSFCADRIATGLVDHATCLAASTGTALAFEAGVMAESFTGLPAGATVASGAASTATELSSERILDEAALQAFVGTGPIEFLVTTLAGFEAFGGGGNSIVEIETYANVALSVDYLYAGITIDKLTNGTDGPQLQQGAPITWTYDVTNTGNTALENVRVTDDREGEICVIALLDAGTTDRCTAQGTAGASDYRNVATAIATPVVNPTIEVRSEDPSSYQVVTALPTPEPTPVPTPPGPPADLRPAVDIELATNGIDADFPPGVDLAVGDDITWTYVVTNTGVVDLFDAVVTDDLAGGICRSDFIAVAAQVECTLTGVAGRGLHARAGTVVAESADGQTVTDVDPTHHHADGAGGPPTGEPVLPGAPVPAPPLQLPPVEAPPAQGPGEPAPGTPDEVLALTGTDSGRPMSFAVILATLGLGTLSMSKAVRRRFGSITGWSFAGTGAVGGPDAT